jgi:hypothetical protein
MSNLLCVGLTLAVLYFLGVLWWIKLTWRWSGGLPFGNARPLVYMKSKPVRRVLLVTLNAFGWPTLLYRIIKDDAP